MTTCPDCRNGTHRNCTSQTWDVDVDQLVDCACWDTHDYNDPDLELPDPYVTDAAEDRYYRSLIGERP